MPDTDKAWEKWGAADPYFGVLTKEKYRRPNLCDESRERFFETGRQDLGNALSSIRKHLDPDFSPRRAIDFGCGTGRVLIPISETCEETLGIDVSDSMLKECLANCQAAGAKNVTLKKSDDLLSALSGQYDLVYSNMVFQHISAQRGEQMIPLLLEHLSHDGIAVLQFAYDWNASVRKRIGYFVRHNVPLAHPVFNLLKGHPLGHPKIELHVYDMGHLLRLMDEAGVKRMHVSFRRNRTCLGALFYLSKKE